MPVISVHTIRLISVSNILLKANYCMKPRLLSLRCFFAAGRFTAPDAASYAVCTLCISGQLSEQAATECYSLDSCPAGSNCALGATFVTPAIVNQQISFAAVSASEYTGMSTSYEMGYGKALNLVTCSGSSCAFETGCTVTSSVDARRSTSVTFTATVESSATVTKPNAGVAAASLATGISTVISADAGLTGTAPAACDITASVDVLSGGETVTSAAVRQCEQGTYATIGATECVQCPALHDTESSGSTSEQDCMMNSGYIVLFAFVALFGCCFLVAFCYYSAMVWAEAQKQRERSAAESAKQRRKHEEVEMQQQNEEAEKRRRQEAEEAERKYQVRRILPLLVAATSGTSVAAIQVLLTDASDLASGLLISEVDTAQKRVQELQKIEALRVELRRVCKRMDVDDLTKSLRNTHGLKDLQDDIEKGLAILRELVMVQISSSESVALPDQSSVNNGVEDDSRGFDRAIDSLRFKCDEIHTEELSFRDQEQYEQASILRKAQGQVAEFMQKVHELDFDLAMNMVKYAQQENTVQQDVSDTMAKLNQQYEEAFAADDFDAARDINDKLKEFHASTGAQQKTQLETIRGIVTTEANKVAAMEALLSSAERQAAVIGIASVTSAQKLIQDACDLGRKTLPVGEEAVAEYAAAKAEAGRKRDLDNAQRQHAYLTATKAALTALHNAKAASEKEISNSQADRHKLRSERKYEDAKNRLPTDTRAHALCGDMEALRRALLAEMQPQHREKCAASADEQQKARQEREDQELAAAKAEQERLNKERRQQLEAEAKLAEDRAKEAQSKAEQGEQMRIMQRKMQEMTKFNQEVQDQPVAQQNEEAERNKRIEAQKQS